MTEPPISLREYVDERFNWQAKETASALAAVREALIIKERADRDALQLSRDQQTYKDEQANRLREQLAQERGEYATKSDLVAMAAKIEAVQKMLWIGFGGLLAFQGMVGILMFLWKKQ